MSEISFCGPECPLLTQLHSGELAHTLKSRQSRGEQIITVLVFAVDPQQRWEEKAFGSDACLPVEPVEGCRKSQLFLQWAKSIKLTARWSSGHHLLTFVAHLTSPEIYSFSGVTCFVSRPKAGTTSQHLNHHPTSPWPTWIKHFPTASSITPGSRCTPVRARESRLKVTKLISLCHAAPPLFLTTAKC